jgi:glyoxylase-like metal-dependent hydrolase (beta-lactamase superfamily II)
MTETPEKGVYILRLESPPGSFMNHVNVILAGEGVLIDAGYPEEGERTLAWANKTAGGGLAALLLTHHHHDHLGGAETLVRETGAASYAHPKEIELMKETAPELAPLPIGDGEKVQAGGIELEALLTPGHSPGHLAFWWAEREILFGGDVVLMPTSTWVGPPLGNLVDYLASLERVRDLAPRVIYPGHGPPVEDPAGRAEVLLRHRARREVQIVQSVSEGYDTPQRIAERIYAGLGERTISIGAKMIISHLEKLAGEGAVRREGESYVLAK